VQRLFPLHISSEETHKLGTKIGVYKRASCALDKELPHAIREPYTRGWSLATRRLTLCRAKDAVGRTLPLRLINTVFLLNFFPVLGEVSKRRRLAPPSLEAFGEKYEALKSLTTFFKEKLTNRETF